MSIIVNHFIPLIGPFIIGVDNLNKEGYDIKTQDIISYPAFKANEHHIENNNYGTVHYLSEELNGSSVEDYKNYIKENGIRQPDIVCSVPPCAGLSLLNSCSTKSCNARDGEANQNDWIYETVKFYLANESKVLLLENAPGLIGKHGFVVLRKIRNILDEYGSGYKMHLTKTTTLNHGLPQDRKRTFLYIYKSENYKIFKQLDRHKPILIEDFMREKGRPEKLSDDIPNHQTLTDVNIDDFFQLVLKLDIIDQFRNEEKDKDILVKTGWGYIMPRFVSGELNLDEYPKIKKIAEHNKYKLSINKGYWDSSPLFIRGKSNAVISKNAFRIVHPYFNRYVSIREHMDLMGLPDDFILEDQKRTFNHICQNVPVNTAMDHLLWGLGLVGGTDTILTEKEYIDNINSAFIQDNSKNQIETTFKIITPNFEKVLDVKNQKVLFHKLF